MKRLLRRVFVACAALGVGGCLSPTLPLPPPTAPEVSLSTTVGYVRLQGSAPATSEVYAFNPRYQVVTGQVVDESARYDFEVKAEPLDRLRVWYVQDGRESESLEVEVPDADASESGAGGTANVDSTGDGGDSGGG